MRIWSADQAFQPCSSELAHPCGSDAMQLCLGALCFQKLARASRARSGAHLVRQDRRQCCYNRIACAGRAQNKRSGARQAKIHAVQGRNLLLCSHLQAPQPSTSSMCPHRAVRVSGDNAAYAQTVQCGIQQVGVL